MIFNIYDVSDAVDDENLDSYEFDVEEATERETGLSSGEMRQALLDRFREAAKNQEVAFINVNFSEYDLTVDEEDLNTEAEIRSVVEDIDKILYDIEDEDMVGQLWILPQEILYIDGEDW